MARSATDILSRDALRFALSITEPDGDDPALDAALDRYIARAVAQVERLVGYPLTARSIDVQLRAPGTSERLPVDLPDFVKWTGFSYVPRGGELWKPTTGALEVGDAAANVDREPGYPYTVKRSKWTRSDRPRFLWVYPNGLTADSNEWPDMEPKGGLTLTASTELVEVPEDLVAAVELRARDLYDGHDRIPANDAVKDFCRHHIAHKRADAGR